MKWLSVRSTPASSSPAISASSVTARRSTIWKSRLGYQHRGVERAMLGGPDRRTIHYAETLAGDSTAGHAAAYCRAVEALSATRVPARGQFLRGAGPGVGAGCQPHWRSRRAGGRRRLPANHVLLRTHSRRRAQHDGHALRQPLWARHDPAGRCRFRRGRRASSSNSGGDWIRSPETPTVPWSCCGTRLR